MRRAEIYYKDVVAGILTETNEGQYIFQYDKEYATKYPGQFNSFSTPVTQRPYWEGVWVKNFKLLEQLLSFSRFQAFDDVHKSLPLKRIL